jgi:hypothetical protein
MYMQKLPTESEQWHNIPENDVMMGATMLAQMKVLVVADRIIAPIFKQAAYNKLVSDAIVNETPAYEPVIYAFANLPTDSPILTLLVELQYREYRIGDDTSENGELERRRKLPHDFLVRVMLRFTQSREDAYDDEDLDPCDYHEHAIDKEESMPEGKR